MTAIASAGSPRWLADTNILSHAIRRPQDALALRIQQITSNAPGALCTSLIVACELGFGARRIASAALQGKIDVILSFVPALPLDRAVVAHYAELRAHLAARGTPIGPNDAFIAAHALALGSILVTDNEEEFRRVPGLQVENWLR